MLCQRPYDRGARPPGCERRYWVIDCSRTVQVGARQEFIGKPVACDRWFIEWHGANNWLNWFNDFENFTPREIDSPGFDRVTSGSRYVQIVIRERYSDFYVTFKLSNFFLIYYDLLNILLFEMPREIEIYRIKISYRIHQRYRFLYNFWIFQFLFFLFHYYCVLSNLLTNYWKLS